MKNSILIARNLLVVIAGTFASLTATANAQEAHPVDAGAGFTYVRTNILPGCNCFRTFGGSAQVQIGMSDHVSALADVTVTHAGNLTPDKYALTQSVYAAGLRGTVRQHGLIRPFGDVLMGITHASGSLSPRNTGAGNSTAFALETGGGILMPLSHRWTLMPAQVHYLFTTFSNGADDRQNDLRITAGILFRLHR